MTASESANLKQVQRMIESDGSVQWIMRKNNKSFIWRHGFKDPEACKTAATRQVEYASSRLPKGGEVIASYSCEKGEVQKI